MATGSPRKLLRRTVDDLERFFGTLTRYPDQRAAFVARVGEARWAELERARAALADALTALGPPDSSPGGGDAAR